MERAASWVARSEQAGRHEGDAKFEHGLPLLADGLPVVGCLRSRQAGSVMACHENADGRGGKDEPEHAVLTKPIDQQYADGGSKKCADDIDERQVANAAQALQQSGLRAGDQGQQHAQPQPANLARVRGVAEYPLRNRFAQQPEDHHASQTKDKIGQPQRAANDGQGGLFAYRRRQLPHATVADTAAGQGGTQPQDGLIQTHQADASRPQQHGQHFHLDDADTDVDDRGATDDGAGTKDLAVGGQGWKSNRAAMT